METNNYPSWLVPIDIAKKLKEIGFNKECNFVLTKSNKIGFTSKNNSNYHFIEDLDKYDYNSKEMVSIPTWTEVLEWFRGKGLFHSICIVEDLIEKVKDFETEIRDNNADIICILHQETYEEARKAAINKLIEIYKQKANE